MDAENENEPSAPSPEDIEFSQTIGRYDDVLSACKLLRARFLMTASNIPDNSGDGDKAEIAYEASTVLDSLNKMEEQFHLLSTQEEMLKEIKVSKLALDLFRSEGPYNGLDDLLREHCANQAKLFELAQSITEERNIQRKISSKLLDQLCHYTASLKDDQIKLDSSSQSEPKNILDIKRSVEKKIKEVRFMQLAIAQIISYNKIDLRQSSTIKEILKSARNPLTSVESFI